jgi:hypothetical protein
MIIFLLRGEGQERADLKIHSCDEEPNLYSFDQ